MAEVRFAAELSVMFTVNEYGVQLPVALSVALPGQPRAGGAASTTSTLGEH